MLSTELSNTGANIEPGSIAAIVKSAARVLSIFEYFERMRVPRTLSEISQDLEYPISSALALLRSVQAMGYMN
jgi:IclR family KDG regulon transcriptional repressor